VNRLSWDWPTVRAAVDARMSELRLSTAELARRTRTSQTTIRAFRKGRTRPYAVTIIGLNEGLELPRGYLRAIAEGRAPDPPLITAGARLARLEEKVGHLISLVRNELPGL
jgi:transcriptional regulator with XRE-family HTH domain